MKIRTIPAVKYEVIWENGDVCEYESLGQILHLLKEQETGIERVLTSTEDYVQELKTKLLDARQKIAHLREYAKQEKAG